MPEVWRLLNGNCACRYYHSSSETLPEATIQLLRENHLPQRFLAAPSTKKKKSVRTSFILHSQFSPRCRYDETQITLTHPLHAAKDAQSSETLIRLH